MCGSVREVPTLRDSLVPTALQLLLHPIIVLIQAGLHTHGSVMAGGGGVGGGGGGRG